MQFFVIRFQTTIIILGKLSFEKTVKINTMGEGWGQNWVIFLFFLSCPKTLWRNKQEEALLILFGSVYKQTKLFFFQLTAMLFINMKISIYLHKSLLNIQYAAFTLRQQFLPFFYRNLNQILQPMAVLKSALRDHYKAPPTCSIGLHFGHDIWG